MMARGCLFVAFAFGQSVVLDFQGFGRLDGLGCLLERGAGIDNVVNDEDAFALAVLAVWMDCLCS